MKHIEAMKQALAVLLQCLDHPDADDAIATIRAAIAEAERAAVQEPVAWGRYPRFTGSVQKPEVVFAKPEGNDWVPLGPITTPPAAPVQTVAWVWNPAQEAWERVRAFGHWQQGAIYAFGTTPPAKLGVTLTDEQKQHIHNVTGAGHALICLVESYINEAMNGGAA